MEPAELSVTVAVNVTDCPKDDGLSDEVTTVPVVAAVTVRVAVLLVLPVPPSFDVTALVVLFCAPTAMPVTFKETVHELLAATVPPLRLMELPLALAVPAQVLLRLLGEETARPAGRLSLNATPVRASVFGFVMVKVRLVEASNGMLAAPKALLIVGGEKTVRLAVAVLPVPPLVELTAPVVLVKCPDCVPVTLTEKLHDPLVAIVPPERLIVFPPAPAEIVPDPHVPLSPFGVDTTSPEGSVSVNATPVSTTVFAAGLVMVKVRVVFPFSEIVVGLKDFAMDGGATTVRFAVAVLPVPPLLEVTAPVTLVYAPVVVPVTVTLNWH